MVKKCSCCGRELPISEFYKNSASKDGYRSKCKACDRATKLAKDTKKKDMTIKDQLLELLNSREKLIKDMEILINKL